MTALLSWLLVVAPMVPVLLLLAAYRRLLGTKRNELKQLLSNTAVGETYRVTFGPYEQVFDAYYNPAAYISASVGLLLAVVSVSVPALVRLHLPPAGVGNEVTATMVQVPGTAFAGAVGAYLYGMYQLIGRYMTRDLYPSALHQMWLAMLVGAVLGPLVASAVTPAGQVLVALAVGALPLRDVWEWVQSKGPVKQHARTLRDPEWGLLQGGSDTLLDQLEAQGITNVAALAFTDPVRLLLTTNLEWNVVLDLIDQALLINYVGEKIDDLRVLGIRSAVEAATVDDRLTQAERLEPAPATLSEERRVATEMLTAMAAVLGIGKDVVRNLCWQMNNDPLVLFIWAYWSVTRPDSDDDERPKAAAAA